MPIPVSVRRPVQVTFVWQLPVQSSFTAHQPFRTALRLNRLIGLKHRPVHRRDTDKIPT
jgi:hypothetical protein